MDIFNKIEKCSHDLALKIGEHETEDDIELYEYSIFMILSYVFTTMSGLFFSIVCGFSLYFVIAHITFVLLRVKAGGYHCDTFKQCFFTTNIIQMLCCAIGVLFQNVAIIMLLCALTMGIVLSPYLPKPTANSPSRGEEEDNRFRKSFIIRLIIISIIDFTFFICGLSSISTTISAGVLAVCFLSCNKGENILNSFWKHFEA